MNPITSASDDALVQEGASHSVSTGDKTERTDTAAASEIIGVETEADLNSVAILSTNIMVSTAPVDYVCVTTTETNPSAEAEPDGDPADLEETGGKRKRNRTPRPHRSQRRRLETKDRASRQIS